MREKRKEIALGDTILETVMENKKQNLSCPKVEL